MKEKNKNILNITKDKLNIKRIAVYLTLLIILGIVIKVFSVEKGNSEEIKSVLKDRGVTTCDNENEKKDIEKFVEDSMLEEGFYTNDNTYFYPQVINKVKNINIDEVDSTNKIKSFSADLKLFNGVFFQNCNVTGEVLYEKDNMKLNNINVNSDNKIYKENNLDENIIGDIALNEMLNKGCFLLESDGDFYEEVIELKREDIKNIQVKNYIIREDNTIRAEVEGSIYLEKYEGEFKFDGIVSISSNLINGNKNNAKKINIYDVPFNINFPSIEEENEEQ